MKTLTRISEMKELVNQAKSRAKTIGLVPTMGYLHEGHLSLVRECRKQTGLAVVSIFVNPLQFGSNEDFGEYPRDINRDRELLLKEGVDVLFCPDVNEMCPEGFQTSVDVLELQGRLCGRTRPGHFRGVSTVVLKLFHIVRPDVAFFGQKDAQQAIVLRRMVQDLNLDVRIEVLPIIRDEDGLALSSRNIYLSPKERKAALVLTKSLKEAKLLIESGERVTEVVIDKVKGVIEGEPLAHMDYVEIVDLEELKCLDKIEGKVLIALAVFIGKTRLIDNMIIQVQGS